MTTYTPNEVLMSRKSGLTLKQCYFIQESNQIEGVQEIYDTDHIDALKKVLARDINRPLTLAFILSLHKTLMCNRLEKAGKLRTVNVYLSGSKNVYDPITLQCIGSHRYMIKEFPKPKSMRGLLRTWIQEYNLVGNSFRSEESIWQLHSDFEAVHPFIDGNGRVGRLLWALDLLRCGKEIHPMLDNFCMRWSMKDGKRNIRLDTFHECRSRYYKKLSEDDKERNSNV